MADLFDTLVARAMGTDVPLMPAMAPRFATPAPEPRLVAPASEDDAGTPTPGRAEVSSVAGGPSVAGPDRAVPRAETDPVYRRHDLMPPDDEPALRRVPDPAPRPAAEASPQDAPSPAPVAPAPDAGPARRRTDRLDVAAAPDQVAVRATLSDPPSVPEPATRRDARATAPNHVAAPTQELATERADVASREASENQARTPTPIEVTVHIGSVVVRSAPVPAAARPRPPTRLPEPRMSLQEYLRQDARR